MFEAGIRIRLSDEDPDDPPETSRGPGPPEVVPLPTLSRPPARVERRRSPSRVRAQAQQPADDDARIKLG